MSGFASAIYEGRVRHRRHAPRAHAFEYRMAQLYLDLDEVDAVFRERWLWSVERPNLASFRRRDFLGDPAQPLAEAVRDRVERAVGERPGGPVRLLTHLRYAGYSFNPVSFYYCHGADGKGLASMGSANLTDKIWAIVNVPAQKTLQDKKAQIASFVAKGVNNTRIMPAWQNRLSPTDIKLLAVYVHQLSGGK